MIFEVGWIKEEATTFRKECYDEVRGGSAKPTKPQITNATNEPKKAAKPQKQTETISATRTTDETQRRLAAWIYACGRSLAEKIHGPTALEHEGTDEFTQDADWETHLRLEINTRLNSVSRDLVYQARCDDDEVRLQKAWATRLL